MVMNGWYEMEALRKITRNEGIRQKNFNTSYFYTALKYYTKYKHPKFLPFFFRKNPKSWQKVPEADKSWRGFASWHHFWERCVFIPKSAKIDQNRPKSAKIGQNRPKSAKIGQNRPKSAQNRPKSSQKSDQNRPKIDQNRPQIDQNRQKIGPKSAQNRPKSAKIDQNRPKIDQNRPKIDQNRPKSPARGYKFKSWQKVPEADKSWRGFASWHHFWERCLFFPNTKKIQYMGIRTKKRFRFRKKVQIF